MGSDPTPPTKRRRHHKKALSPRLAKLDKEFEEAGGEWREQEIDEFFDIFNGKRLTRNEIVSGNVPYISSSSVNNGIQEYIEIHDSSAMYENCLSIAYNGKDTAVFYHPYRAFFSDNVRVVKYKDKNAQKFQYLFTANLFKKIRERFNYGNPMSSTKLRKEKIKLPFLNNQIAFSYMENYIKALEAERIETLEAYLTVTGLKDYHLTKNDEKILDTFTKLTDTESRVEYLGILSPSPVSMRTLFPSIHQGRRLKKDDQIQGDLPFVMAGTTNTGIVGKIGNDVRKFPKHSITIDIFGNTFYRGYEFGAGDDTGVFWNTENTQPKSLLFLKTIIEKQLLGKYDFGHKLRASQTYDMEFQIPTQNNQPDYTFMSDFIKVIEKLVIKDLVEWTDKKIQATKEVVAQH
ncbi:TPA: restriction endonuclease subunit S [Streptococcus suis]